MRSWAPTGSSACRRRRPEYADSAAWKPTREHGGGRGVPATVGHAELAQVDALRVRRRTGEPRAGAIARVLVAMGPSPAAFVRWCADGSPEGGLAWRSPPSRRRARPPSRSDRPVPSRRALQAAQLGPGRGRRGRCAAAPAGAALELQFAERVEHARQRQGANAGRDLELA